MCWRLCLWNITTHCTWYYQLLWPHLSDMKIIFNRCTVFWWFCKKGKMMEWRNWLDNPTPDRNKVHDFIFSLLHDGFLWLFKPPLKIHHYIISLCSCYCIQPVMYAPIPNCYHCYGFSQSNGVVFNQRGCLIRLLMLPVCFFLAEMS